MKRTVTAIFLVFLCSVALAETSSVNRSPAKCVQIYYDHAPSVNDPAYYNGRLYAVALQNLISHFPTIQQYSLCMQ